MAHNYPGLFKKTNKVPVRSIFAQVEELKMKTIDLVPTSLIVLVFGSIFFAEEMLHVPPIQGIVFLALLVTTIIAFIMVSKQHTTKG
jgi:hypothetical protein